MITTTIARILPHGPRYELIEQLRGAGQDDNAPMSFADIESRTSLSFAVWCCRSVPEHWRTWVRLSDWCLGAADLPRSPNRVGLISEAEMLLRDAVEMRREIYRAALNPSLWPISDRKRAAAVIACDAKMAAFRDEFLRATGEEHPRPAADAGQSPTGET